MPHRTHINTWTPSEEWLDSFDRDNTIYDIVAKLRDGAEADRVWRRLASTYGSDEQGMAIGGTGLSLRGDKFLIYSAGEDAFSSLTGTAQKVAETSDSDVEFFALQTRNLSSPIPTDF